MNLHIKPKNYRCFAERPVEISFREGVTAILGPNNAGKSTIGKLFYCLRPLFDNLQKPDLFKSWIDQPALSGKGYLSDSSFSGQHEELQRWACRNSTGSFQLEISNESIAFDVEINLRTCQVLGIGLQKLDGSDSFRIRRAVSGTDITREFNGTTEARRGYKLFSGPLDQFRESLLPMFVELSGILFLPAIRSAQNVQAKTSHYDLHYGLNLFTAWQKTQTSGNSTLARQAYLFQKEIARIFGVEDFSLHLQQNNSSLLATIDGEQFILEELGNGLAQFIAIGITLLSATPSYVFIDEPETGLHPHLQRALIEFIQTFCSSGTAFTTHSVGLARAAADYLYLIAHDKNGVPEVKQFVTASRPGELLGELSFATYQELGCSRILLVEGRTDVAPIQHWIRQLGLDHEIVVFSLAGNEGIHRLKDELGEYRRVCPNLAVIMDRETSSSAEPIDPRRMELKAECERQGVPCLLLERRALENYFPTSAVRQVHGPEFEQLAPFDRPHGVWPDHSKKRHNQALAAVTPVGDLNGTDLHAFLQSLLPTPVA